MTAIEMITAAGVFVSGIVVALKMMDSRLKLERRVSILETEMQNMGRMIDGHLKEQNKLLRQLVKSKED